ncbi:MAG: 4,5-dihydroxyphthalate decarboxylase [Chloroflexi bacterium]|nr:4,5-dihydroxyphthalate decarboxylase [Chloroflexota bacterium]
MYGSVAGNGKLSLTLACGDYDRTHALLDRSIEPEGIDLNYLPINPPGEIFWRMLRHAEFDASELSLSAYILGIARGDTRFVGIPVFPLRIFRHSFIWVNPDAGIQEPGDLKGKRFAIPEYHMTAMLFIRGMLQDDFGVRARDVTWFRNRVERVSIDLPPEIRVEDIGPNRKLNDMIERGEIDAVGGTRPPTGLSDALKMQRLFLNPREEEIAFYRRTHIFPIMHIVAIRREIYERHPWVAESLAKAFRDAKERAYERMKEVSGLVSLPWLDQDIEDERRVFGGDPYPYGVEPNRPTLEAATRYSYEQGLSKRIVPIEELFAAESLDRYSDTF